MLILFQVCFGVGLGYAILSFAFEHLLGFLNVDTDVDGGADAGFDLDSSVDLDVDIDVDLDFDASMNGSDIAGVSGGHTISPFKPTIIAAFLVTFGGVGIIAAANHVVYVALVAAGLIGLLVAYVIYRFVYVPLYRAQNTSAVEIQSLVGNQAKVSEYIPQGKYGKITYYVNGNTYSAPAKSESGAEIARNTTVEIVAIVKNTYYVREYV